MSAPDTRAARLNWVALASALVPLAVANVCYLVSATAGHIPLCVPYVEGCTSISASGRYGMAYWLFKAGMLPSELFSQYQERGEHPFIFRDSDMTMNVRAFDHLQYASLRSTEVCGGK